jgi:hypothetical protein
MFRLCARCFPLFNYFNHIFHFKAQDGRNSEIAFVFLPKLNDARSGRFVHSLVLAINGDIAAPRNYFTLSFSLTG